MPDSNGPYSVTYSGPALRAILRVVRWHKAGAEPAAVLQAVKELAETIPFSSDGFDISEYER